MSRLLVVKFWGPEPLQVTAQETVLSDVHFVPIGQDIDDLSHDVSEMHSSVLLLHSTLGYSGSLVAFER